MLVNHKTTIKHIEFPNTIYLLSFLDFYWCQYAWTNSRLPSLDAVARRCTNKSFTMTVGRKNPFWKEKENPCNCNLQGHVLSVNQASVSKFYVFHLWFSMRKSYIHYNDVIMGAMASQITSLTIVYSTVYSCEDQRKHQSSASLAFFFYFFFFIFFWGGNSPGTGEFPAQKDSNAENVSSWWRNHGGVLLNVQPV